MVELSAWAIALIVILVIIVVVILLCAVCCILRAVRSGAASPSARAFESISYPFSEEYTRGRAAEGPVPSQITRARNLQRLGKAEDLKENLVEWLIRSRFASGIDVDDQKLTIFCPNDEKEAVMSSLRAEVISVLGRRHHDFLNCFKVKPYRMLSIRRQQSRIGSGSHIYHLDHHGQPLYVTLGAMFMDLIENDLYCLTTSHLEDAKGKSFYYSSNNVRKKLGICVAYIQQNNPLLEACLIRIDKAAYDQCSPVLLPELLQDQVAFRGPYTAAISEFLAEPEEVMLCGGQTDLTRGRMKYYAFDFTDPDTNNTVHGGIVALPIHAGDFATSGDSGATVSTASSQSFRVNHWCVHSHTTGISADTDTSVRRDHLPSSSQSSHLGQRRLPLSLQQPNRNINSNVKVHWCKYCEEMLACLECGIKKHRCTECDSEMPRCLHCLEVLHCLECDIREHTCPNCHLKMHNCPNCDPEVHSYPLCAEVLCPYRSYKIGRGASIKRDALPYTSHNEMEADSSESVDMFAEENQLAGQSSQSITSTPLVSLQQVPSPDMYSQVQENDTGTEPEHTSLKTLCQIDDKSDALDCEDEKVTIKIVRSRESSVSSAEDQVSEQGQTCPKQPAACYTVDEETLLKTTTSASVRQPSITLKEVMTHEAISTHCFSGRIEYEDEPPEHGSISFRMDLAVEKLQEQIGAELRLVPILMK